MSKPVLTTASPACNLNGRGTTMYHTSKENKPTKRYPGKKIDDREAPTEYCRAKAIKAHAKRSESARPTLVLRRIRTSSTAESATKTERAHIKLQKAGLAPSISRS